MKVTRRVERLGQGALHRLGRKTQILPPATKADLLTGRAVAIIGQCCPTSLTTGNLAVFLNEETENRFYEFSASPGLAPVSGRISGNSSTSLMDGESVSNITRRSMPIPSPAVGGRAYSSARM